MRGKEELPRKGWREECKKGGGPEDPKGWRDKKEEKEREEEERGWGVKEQGIWVFLFFCATD